MSEEQLGRRAGVNGAYVEILEAAEPRRLLGPIPQRLAWGLRCQLDELLIIGWIRPVLDLDAPDPDPVEEEPEEPEEERDSDEGWGYRDPEEKRLWLSHLA